MNSLLQRSLGFGIIVMFSTSCNKTPVIFPERKDIIETIYASGKIIADNEYRLSSLSNGTIIKKLVKDGDPVLKGQLLYIVSNKAAKEKFNAASKNFHIV